MIWMLNYALHNTTHIHFIQWILFMFFEFQKLLVNFHPCMISILWKRSRVSIETISVFHNGWTSQILRIWQEENHLFQLPMLAPSLLGGKWNKQQQLCGGAGRRFVVKKRHGWIFTKFRHLSHDMSLLIEQSLKIQLKWAKL